LPCGTLEFEMVVSKKLKTMPTLIRSKYEENKSSKIG
jgi:hypothetical protein